MMVAFGTLRRCARHSLTGLVLAGALTACGNGDDDSSLPAGTVKFGPLTDEPVAFTLAGTLRYEDRLLGEKEPGVYGFTGTTEYNPVRYAVVDVVDENNQVLQTGSTDSQGHFSISTTAAGLLHLRVLARTEATTGIAVEVRNSGGEVYAVSRYFVPRAGDLSFEAPVDIPIASMAGAFNILDVFTAGAEFIHEKDGAFPRKLVAYWQPGSPDGTYFMEFDDSIHVLGGSDLGVGDTDEYDDDVLLHEYGHFVESFTGNLDSFGGEHFLGDNTQDLRLAWSEGWASFVSGTIKKWLRGNAAMASIVSDTTGVDSQYLDTFHTGQGVWWDFDVDYSSFSLDDDKKNSYASSETAVAKVLWSVTKAFDYSLTWAAYRAFPEAPRTRPVSLETYWDNWLTTDITRGHNAVPHFVERRVTYSADAFESDDTSAASQLLVSTGASEHTLYNAGMSDADYFSVNLTLGTQYTIETYDLTNGADTELALLDGNGQTACSGDTGDQACTNDNASNTSYVGESTTLNINNGNTLASRLLFTPSASGTYYIRVATASTPSLAAGRYGSYRIRINSAP